MVATIAMDEELLAKAKSCTGLTEPSAVVDEALRSLVQRDAAQRLKALGGCDPDAEVPARRRPEF